MEGKQVQRGILQKCRVKCCLSVACAMIWLWGSGFSWAYDLPLGLNLGFTSFLDGGPPAGPGFYLTEYVQYITSTRLNDNNGNRLLPAAADEDLNVWVSLTQFIYQSDFQLIPGFGILPSAKPGLNLMVPLVSIDLDHNLGPFGPQDNDTGIGDILVGPFLQWDPLMYNNRPVFMHRIEFQLMFPTGKYDSNRELNPGSNFFSFNPYWAATVFITPKWTASWRLHYLWNAENDDPNRGFVAAGFNDSQAGEAVHLNFTSAYELWEKRLRAGINGYYLQQTTDTKANGIEIPGRREEVLAIGPGAVFHLSQHTHFFMNLYFETDAKNRPESNRLTMRVVHHF